MLFVCASGWSGQNPSGQTLFDVNCAQCHRPDSGTRAPVPGALRRMTRESILRALETGTMKEQGAKLSAVDRRTLADYLGVPSSPQVGSSRGACLVRRPLLKDDPGWNGWGVDAFNDRRQPAGAAALRADQVPRLRVKWAFGFPDASSAFGQPVVTGGRVFVGSQDGTVYSLDASTGCTYWSYKAETTVKTAVVVSLDQRAAFFGDTGGKVYAVSAATGSLLWKTVVDPHPAARITGSPLLVGGRLYVPVSSGEEGSAIDPHYRCCTFRGSVAALNASTGKLIWKAYVIPEPAKPTGRKNSSGVELWGPSGGAVWSSPTADLKRHVIYIASGNSYSEPSSPYTDAVLAFDMDTGKMLWHQQLTPGDRWNIACVSDTKANCPENPGGDLDFGAPPMLVSLPRGRQLLIASQKSGIVHTLDPDHYGRIVWQTRIGHGGALGGIEWGGAVEGSLAYFPLSDWEAEKPDAGGGLYALRIATGDRAWYAAPPKPACASQPGCSAAAMAPPTVIPGVVFSGSEDGHLRAYNARDGKLIWDFNTLGTFSTVNGVAANGGSLNASGPTVANGMLYVQSGYDNGITGNVLLALSVDGK